MKLTVKPRTIIAAVLAVFLLFGGVLGVLVWQSGQGPSTPENPSNNSTGPSGEPPITTNYYEKSSLDSGVADQQRELLKYYKNADATLTVTIDSSQEFRQKKVHEYKVDYENGVYLMNSTGPVQDVQERATTDSATWTRFNDGSVRSDAKPFDKLQPVNSELAIGAQLIEYQLNYQRAGTGQSNGYQYVEFENQKQGQITVPFSDFRASSYSSVNSTVRIDENNVVRYVKTTATVNDQQGNKYDVTIVYRLNNYNSQSYSLPAWAQDVEPAPDLCADGAKAVAHAEKLENGYEGRFGVETLGDAESVTFIVNGEEVKEFTDSTTLTGLYRGEDTVKLVANGESGCTRTLGEYTISELANSTN